MIRICSHTRTGTHYLAKLLFQNVAVEAVNYEELHYSHSKLPPGDQPYVHLWRGVFPVMLSIWKVREHLGIHRDVTFSELIRHTYDSVPKTDVCEVLFNGQLSTKACPPRRFLGTYLDRWLHLTTLFAASAQVNVHYSLAVERPKFVTELIASKLGYKLLPRFVPVLHRVGWYNEGADDPIVTHEDFQLMEQYECKLPLFGMVQRS